MVLGIILFSSAMQIMEGKSFYDIFKSSPILSSNIESSQKMILVNYTEMDMLLNDYLMPFVKKVYVVKVSENSLLLFSYFVDTEKAKLEVTVDGPVNKTRISAQWLSQSNIYYVGSEGDTFISVNNPQDYTVYYRFYIDTSQTLDEANSKLLPFEGSQVAFHIDLRKDDRVLINLNDINHFNPRYDTFVLYNEFTPKEVFYFLQIYGQSSSKPSSFTADLGGRYYIIIDSKEGRGEFSLAVLKDSPPWNQEWFWLLILIAFFIITTFLTNMLNMKNPDKSVKFAFLSCYFWLLTSGLLISVTGSFYYGTTIYMPLFYVLVFSWGFSSIVQIYASYLDRKKTTEVCQFCGKAVDIHKDNYCCGQIVKKISAAWFFMPLLFNFLFFAISYVFSELLSPGFLDYSIWIGSCGSIVGGVIGWRLNRTIYKVNLWRKNTDLYGFPRYTPFMAIGLLLNGIILALVLPFFLNFFLMIFLQQNTELFLSPGLVWFRTRIAALTIPSNMVYIFFLSSSVSMILIIMKFRRLYK